MRLFIAEKKVLGEAIASALDGDATTKDSVIYKGDNAVVWCSGHLLTLREPESYNEKYKSWNIADLPIYFNDWQNAVPKENAARVKQIGELIKSADEVVNCGDIDEEGQLLVDEILRWFKYTGPCKRLDTANTTVDALKKALLKMKDNKDCELDGWSAYAREVADMTFGINFTRYFSKVYNAKLPVGRVMTPTLGLVVNRDQAIEGHKKSYYYNLYVDSLVKEKTVRLRFIPEKDLDILEDGKFLSDDFLKQLSKDIINQNGIYEVKKENLSEIAPLPFNLTTLNSYCGKKWGYNPDKVMKITQSLRDDYSAITYNRSDCQYLSMEHFREAPDTIAAICSNLNTSADSFNTSKAGRCFNDANITAHFAIIPTNQKFDINKLSKEQMNVYLAICKYYLIQFLPNCKKEKTIMSLPVTFKGKNVGKLEATASKIVSAGFRAMLGSEEREEDEEEIADINIIGIAEGKYNGIVQNTEIQQKETKPPKRYTQTSLFVDMTRISKYVDDPEIKKLLLEKDKEKKGENGSIGTSATRAEIIKKLISIGFLEEKKEGKKEVLISTEKGRKFYSLLPDEIKKADITAKWWVIQEDIKTGTASYKDLTEGVVDLIKSIMSSFTINESDTADFSFKPQSLCKCPSCGQDILKGKFGPYCSNKCGFRLQYVFGKKVTEKQYISLCNGKKVRITGIQKKDGSGTFDAFAIPYGVEDVTYTSKGVTINAKQLKLEMSFK